MSRDTGDATPFIPSGRLSLTKLRDAAADCEGCELYRIGTQTVFGAGSASARIMLIGEQPGDSEDRAGLPFVGPAGKILDRALSEAGISQVSCVCDQCGQAFQS
jgi:DNA polymerase